MKELKSKIFKEFENIKETTIEKVIDNSNGQLLLIENEKKILFFKLIKKESASYTYLFSIIKNENKYVIKNSILYYLEDNSFKFETSEEVIKFLKEQVTLDKFCKASYDYLKGVFYITIPEIFGNIFKIEKNIENELAWRNYKEYNLFRLFDKEDKEKTIEIKPSEELKKAFNF
ncbi:MAG: hypothetical protein KBA47_01580 [Caldisericia bacterium]|nr:hypothetical protein [Caldisericia bacterium]